MHLRCLLFSQDERSVRMLKLLLDDFSIQVDHCTALTDAQHLLWGQKLDGVVADCELPDGVELLRSVRRSKHNQKSIAFAVTGTEMKMAAAFDMGAHFVIHKPLINERVKRTLSAARGLMMREKRLHFRHPANANVNIRLGHDLVIPAAMCDLSQHGALVATSTVLKRHLPVRLSFTLPETSFAMEVNGRVTWSDLTGRAGIKFESLTDDTRGKLLEWALRRSVEEKQLPPTTKSSEDDRSTELAPEEALFDFDVEVVEPKGQDETDNRLRATLRGEHRCTVKVLTFEKGAPVIVQGTCNNLSELGLAASLDQNLPVGEAVLLQMQLPGVEKPVVLHATVRHHEKEQVGFEFVGVDQVIKDLLRDSVQELPVQ